MTDESWTAPPAYTWNVFGLVERLASAVEESLDVDDHVRRWLDALPHQDAPSITASLEQIAAALLFLKRILESWPDQATVPKQRQRVAFMLTGTRPERDANPELWALHQALAVAGTTIVLAGFDEADALEAVSATIRLWTPAERAAVHMAITPLRGLVSLVLSKVVYWTAGEQGSITE